MLANITPNGEGCIAEFHRILKHPIKEVWAYLTDNEKLQKWFSELRVEALREGGRILFDMQNGTFEEMTITSYEHNAVLAFTWGEDAVRFELHPAQEGTLLVMKETIHRITPHTPRDLAGWHVCLDVIASLLDGRDFGSREKVWKPLYEQYKEAMGAMK
ncbi:SRPBCC family protein [Paenibacillus terrigena]|uniref:SRPBCC family protein n=1 Tax=Paenibacillus terrigena TaxID=369333 RepID=UPI0028D730C0|nr:SRPBCC family protein [Paenibacillus terrigena]